MPDTPPESDSSPGGEAPALAAGSERARALTADGDGTGRRSFHMGEVLDFGEQGRFTVKERLGRGGTGEVYRAEYVSPDAPKFPMVFALKVFRPGARPRGQDTFIDELELLSQLQHDTISRYHTYFLDHGRQVLVMEYVEGRSLRSLIRLARRKGRTLSESTTFELLAQIAEALDYAHTTKDEQGHPLHIVHRDISPANIRVSATGFAKLVDFGVARAGLGGRPQALTGARLVQDRSPYLSPEQAQGKPLDGRADLFSLCCVLVEMLTGAPPFGQTRDRATRPLSRKVRAICRKGLARDPARRFANGCELARALLAHHDYRGPTAIREEIAALEALPDLSPELLERRAADLQRVQPRPPALERIRRLVLPLLLSTLRRRRT